LLHRGVTREAFRDGVDVDDVFVHGLAGTRKQDHAKE
jgi:hypothetical protein